MLSSLSYTSSDAIADRVPLRASVDTLVPVKMRAPALRAARQLASIGQELDATAATSQPIR